MANRDFAQLFTAATGHAPFPWQESLYERFISDGDDNIPPSCDIPTGLGKTSIIPIWLIALANNAGRMPRRLVYVVNRRTVVDQTTNEVETLRLRLMEPEQHAAMPEHVSALQSLADSLAGLSGMEFDAPLAISTLRGQFADNREWSADPSRPAVICGTVDMIGSRLLFSGYGVGFKAKPLHAGFLGQDALLVHDEAHLEPAFQTLIETIECEQKRCGDFRPLRVMELTATSRGGGEPFTLTAADDSNAIVKQRIEANKSLSLHPIDDEKKLPDAVAEFCDRHRESNAAVLVYLRTVEDVEKVAEKLRKSKRNCETLTGTMRGKERDELVETSIFQRFLPESNRDQNITPEEGTVYLICTSAGEVGVNISADHLVCDLSTFESMAQRFGRVNRFGERDDTRIDVLYPTSFWKKGKITELDKSRERTLELLRRLNGDASPKALSGLNQADRLAAFAPPPTILPVSDILFDSWALTTIREPLPGRPPVEPYLHGKSEWEPPQTTVVWREEVDVVSGILLEKYSPDDLLDDYPLKPHELLRDRSDRVRDQLLAIAKRMNEPRLFWFIDERGRVEVCDLKALSDLDKKAAQDRIANGTVLLPPSAGGLTDSGTLDGKLAYEPEKKSRYDVSDPPRAESRRCRVWSDDPKFQEKRTGMRLIRTIDLPVPEDEENSPPRTWYWFEMPLRGVERSKTALNPVTLDDHTADVVRELDQILDRLRLENELRDALRLAAEYHDLGKKRVLWQRSIGHRIPENPSLRDWLAKSGSKKRLPGFRTDYRHEFGSLLDTLAQDAFNERIHDPDGQELILHVIAAHHGRGRPHFPKDRDVDEAFDPEPKGGDVARVAAAVPRRFARLQQKYGRWGLAYLESLLRAADWAASASPSNFVEPNSERTHE